MPVDFFHRVFGASVCEEFGAFVSSPSCAKLLVWFVYFYYVFVVEKKVVRRPYCSLIFCTCASTSKTKQIHAHFSGDTFNWTAIAERKLAKRRKPAQEQTRADKTVEELRANKFER